MPNVDALDALFEPFDSKMSPGIVAAVAIEGEPVYCKGFGLASIELPVSLTPMMRMRIGSITKHFTALAYLLLCEDGKASLDDQIGKYIPELHPENHQASVRDLLAHISGLRDVFDYTMQLQGTNLRVTEEEMLRWYVAAEGLNGPRAREWAYNNGGYLLVSIAIARISGMPFSDFLAKRIFEPIGMHDTLLRSWDTEFLPNSAALHLRLSDTLWSQHYMGMDLSGAGGIASTAHDMLLWLRHMDDPVVGNPSSWRSLKCPVTLENGRSTGYGLGLEIGSYRGARTISHSGSVISGTSQMIKVPQASLDIIIISNRSDVGTVTLAQRVIDLCIEALPPAGAAGTILPVSGTFLSPETGRVLELSRSNGQGQMTVDGLAMPACLGDDGVIRLAPPLASDHLEIIAVGESPAHLEFRSLGYDDELIAVVPQANAALPFTSSDYLSKGGSFAVRIKAGSAGPQMISEGPQAKQAFRLEPITDRIWKFLSGTSAYRAGVIRFSPDFSSFTLTAARTRNWQFERTSTPDAAGRPGRS